MTILPSLLLPIAALAAAAAQPAAQADPAEVVAAERAFAKDAQALGIGPTFRAHAAPDAISFAPDPTPAAPLLARPAPPGPKPTLTWWPVYAGIAASGDLGFTTGPYRLQAGERQRQGHYFTVWRRQADGRWKWVLDHGPSTTVPSPLGPETPVAALPAAASQPATQEKGWQALLATEAKLAAGLAGDAPAALHAALAEDARVLRQGPQPAAGRGAFRPLLAAGPATIEAAHLGGGISAAGDLAFTYGHAGWSEAGKRIKGHYVRIWQQREGGWRLVVDEILPAPPLPQPQPQPLAASPAPAAPAAP